eukprot:COSAG06_NODE_41810_length_387_cov_1.243056_1_plen_65_part_10
MAPSSLTRLRASLRGLAGDTTLSGGRLCSRENDMWRVVFESVYPQTPGPVAPGTHTPRRKLRRGR